MGYRKCPKCELNYIKDDQKLCDVCSRKYKPSEEESQEIEMCSECGENPALKGKELCAACYKETLRQEQFGKAHKPPVVTAIGAEDTDLDGVEVPIDVGEIPEDELTVEERAFDGDPDMLDGEDDIDSYDEE